MFSKKSQSGPKNKVVGTPDMRDKNIIVEQTNIIKIQQRDVNIVNRQIYDMDIKNQQQRHPQPAAKTMPDQEQNSINDKSVPRSSLKSFNLVTESEKREAEIK